LVYYVLGDQPHWVYYRIPSWVSGVAAVVLGGSIAVRAGRREALLATTLMAGSYLMIHFSSEARGYALVVCFGFATFLAVRRFAQAPHGRWAILSWLCMILGFLAHLMYLHVFVAAAVWLLVRFLRTGRSLRDIIAPYTLCFAIPVVLLLGYYGFFVRNATIGAGPRYELFAVLVKTLSLAGGGPPAGFLAMGVSACMAGLFLGAIIWLWRKGSDEWVFYVIVVFFSPTVIMILMQPKVLFVRYFIISIAFGFIAVSCMLVDLCRRGKIAGTCGAIALGLFLIGNGVNVTTFFRYGHGGYQEVLQYMVDHTPGKEVTISSGHDFGNGMLVRYYKKYMLPDLKITYLSKDRYTAEGSMWFILHNHGTVLEFNPIQKDPYGNTYRLVKTFPYTGMISGSNWFVYQREQQGGGNRQNDRNRGL